MQRELEASLKNLETAENLKAVHQKVASISTTFKIYMPAWNDAVGDSKLRELKAKTPKTPRKSPDVAFALTPYKQLALVGPATGAIAKFKNGSSVFEQPWNSGSVRRSRTDKQFQER